MISNLAYTESAAHIYDNNIVAVASILVPSHYIRVELPKDPPVAHKVFPIQDDEDESIYHFFEPSSKFIAEHLPKGNVLVHC